MTSRVVKVLAVLTTVVALSGCNLVPTDDRPQTVSRSQVPNRLLEPATYQKVELAFFTPTGVVRLVSRSLPTPVTIQSVLDALTRAPQGLTTDVTPSVVRLARTHVGTTLTFSGLSPATAGPSPRLTRQLLISLRPGFHVSEIVWRTH